MLKSLIILAACSLLSGDAALKLPSYIKACSYNDPNFNQCALKHGKEAIPKLLNGDRKYGFPPLDPMYVEEVMVKESGITIKAINFTIEGARDVDLKHISVDFDKQTISFDLNVPQAIFRGKYEMAGKLVQLPISGNGDFNCTYEDLYVNYKTEYKLVRRKDGEIYAKPTDYDLDFKPQNLIINFNNLFNGNKLLGDAMNKFLNENWRLVLDEIGKPAYKALGLIVHQIVTNVAKKVPFKELFLDTPAIPGNVEDEFDV
ncbi:protein takeout-like [Periplaneta americana]|uniref:protein takeout-like n=1 Tax=Periplaneta americana TaxID=6978 RepID=UPI0037E878BA